MKVTFAHPYAEHGPGDSADLADDEALRLIHAGRAVPVEPDPEPDVPNPSPEPAKRGKSAAKES